MDTTLLAASASSTAADFSLDVTPLMWATLLVVCVVLYTFDLVVFGRRHGDVVPLKASAWWTLFWFAVGVSFWGVMYLEAGTTAANLYLSGFIVEKSLSVDNVFVFAIIISYFSVPQRLHKQVLFWGILGALFLRAIFILVGAELIENFAWILVGLGLLLIYTAYTLIHDDEFHVEPEDNRVLNMIRRVIPMSDEYDGGKLFSREAGRRVATPMLAVMIMIINTDIIFAIDSIPAVFGITTEAFIVITANAFSLLGLRALYFVVEAAMQRFIYLNYGLAIVLAWIGVKMLLEFDWPTLGVILHIPVWVSLTVVTGVLSAAILISWVATRDLPDHGLVTDPEDHKRK